MSTIDGPQKLLDILRDIADNEDKLNALSGTGLVLRTGVVLSSLPEVTVAMDGESSLGGPMIFEEAKGDLLVPEDMMLTSGDTVAMAPLSKRRWVIMFKTRLSREEMFRARYGLNNDRTGGEFAGLEVVMDPVTGEVTINLVGGTTNVNGNDVLVNGNEILPEGIQGPIGPEGPAGPEGPRGPQGVAGPTGPTGAQGPAGTQGPTGSPGAASTVPGPTGPTGPTGAAGPQGPQGVLGATGPTGVQGPLGPTGLPGTSGAGVHEEFLLGAAATTITLSQTPDRILMVARNGVVQSQAGGDYTVAGAVITITDPAEANTRFIVEYAVPQTGAGIPGPAGATGPQGPAGPAGSTGAQGSIGPAGPTGATGPQGAQGLQGTTGAQGPTGPQGTQGVPGPVGPTGPQGATGATGPTGATGIGVPAGGTAGQILTKNSSTNYDTLWQAPAPSGITMPLTQPLTFSPDITHDIGASGTTRPRNLYLGSYVEQATIAKPANPPAGMMRIYPKSDGEYYKLNSAGQETVLGAGAQAADTEEFLPANGATTITLSRSPQDIWMVTRNGLVQTTAAGDWTVLGNVLTFTDAFTGAERVTVHYAFGVVGATGPIGPSSSVHEEFMPANGATTVVLSQVPQSILMIARAGVVQSQVDGNYSLAVSTITFTDAFDGTERVIVDYASTSYTPTPPINGSGISTGTLPGSALIDQAITNTKLAADTARANLLVNGGFEIWQRGNGPFTSAYCADRYFVGVAGTDTVSVTKNTATVDSGSRTSMQVAYTRVTGGSNIYQQLMAADGHQLGGKTVSASVRVRAGVAGHCWLLLSGTGTGVVAVGSAYHPGGNTWQTLTCSAFVVPTDYTYVLFQILFSQTDTLYFDNAMIVVGSVPADYAPLPPADDMARCQRYYEFIFGASAGALALGSMVSATTMYIPFPMKTRKAVSPTITYTATINMLNSTASAGYPITAFSSGWSDVVTCAVQFTAATAPNAAGQAILVQANNGTLVAEANP